MRLADPRAAQARRRHHLPGARPRAGLDVTANLFLGRELTRAGVSTGRRCGRAARSRLRSRGVEIDVDQPVAELWVGRRQIVAIVQAPTYASRILVMDEPTAALTAAEVDRLFAVMRDIAARGVGIVYISHRLEEVPRVADRVTVLRDGQVAGIAPARAPQSELVRLLVGRPLNRALSRAAAARSGGACCILKARATGRGAPAPAGRCRQRFARGARRRNRRPCRDHGGGRTEL